MRRLKWNGVQFRVPCLKGEEVYKNNNLSFAKIPKTFVTITLFSAWTKIKSPIPIKNQTGKSWNCVPYAVVYINPHLPSGPAILINWMNAFPVLGVSGLLLHFFSIFNRNSCKQTVKTLIRRRILWHLIWVCTVCLCPKNGTLGLNRF